MKKNIKGELEILSQYLESLADYIKDLWQFLPLALCSLTPKGLILEVNKAFETLSLWPISEISGKHLSSILSEKDASKIINQTLKKKSLSNQEINLLNKKKEKIAVAAYSRVREDRKGNIIGLFLAFVDIRENKKLREELEQRVSEKTKELQERMGELEKTKIALMNILEDIEEERRRVEEEKNKTLAVITNFADGLLVFDKEGKLSLINPQAENFLKIKRKEILGKSILELANVSNLSSLVNLLGKEIEGVFRKELAIREDLTLEVSTVPMMSEEEKLGVLVILHDITREKMIERIKTEFVSLAAHQLRTPISAIRWTLRMLLDGDLGPITQEQREFIEKTYKSNERMTELINDLLNITRIEEGRYLYKPAFTNIEPIIQSVIDSYKEEIEKKKIKFEFKKLQKKLPLVKVDTEKIKLAISNLLENAIKYTPTGGEVMISLNLGKNEIIFSIKDTGVGIPKDQQERVFTKFFRGSNVMRMETEGTGLGLFITKNIIEAHGGRIWFESEEGKGTTFYFALPVKEEFGEFLKEF